MRIIQVVNVRWFNATAWYALFLSCLLEKAGHEVVVITQKNTKCEAAARELGLKTLDIPLNSVNPLAVAESYRRIRKLVTAFQPHVVNCHRGEGFILWGMAKLAIGNFALVRTRGDQRLPKNNFPNRWLHTHIADAVVATNKIMARHFIKTLGIPPEQVWLILGGVDTSRFHFDANGRDAVRSEFDFSKDDVVIGMVGRLDDHVKGQREFLQAAGMLKHEHGVENLKILLVSFDTTTSSDEIMQWAQEEGISEIVHITGKRKDIAACISALDLGVSCSRYSETIARAPMEIMACKRPLIATAVGVLPDLVSDDALVPPEDPEALAATLHNFIADEHARDSLVKLQQATMGNYSGQDFLRTSLNLYEDVASPHRL